MTRLIALMMLCLPGVLAVFGVKWMRDTVFQYTNPLFGALWLQFIAGFLAFVIGIGFIGGWIFYRDRKRHYVAEKFMKNRSQSK